jgi:hypothetical protein
LAWRRLPWCGVWLACCGRFLLLLGGLLGCEVRGVFVRITLLELLFVGCHAATRRGG